MREIKFRAWYEAKPEYHRGEQINRPTMLYDSWPGECCLFAHQGQPLNLMQYTGLKDKNGREIYEGDIVRNTTTIIRGDKITKPEECIVVAPVMWGKYADWEYVDAIECWMWGESSLSECLSRQACHDKSEKERGYWQGSYNRYWDFKGDIWEVIGNIYENPELMEVE